MRKKRHNYSAQEEVAILKGHLVDRVAVSDLCDEYHLQPTVFIDGRDSSLKMGLSPLKPPLRGKRSRKSSVFSTWKRRFKRKTKFSPNWWKLLLTWQNGNGHEADQCFRGAKKEIQSYHRKPAQFADSAELIKSRI